MKIKALLLILATSLLALFAWLVHVPQPIQADEVPEAYRDTLAKGLAFLARNQGKDGHWEGDGGKHPVAVTGLVGLALLMDSPTPKVNFFNEKDLPAKANYLANMRLAADWLMQQSKPEREGLIFSEHASETTRYMEGHGLATLFLAGMLQFESDAARKKKLTDVVTRAVKYIVKAQSTNGGWYHTSKVEGHDFDETLATVIQLQALQAADNASIPVPRDALDKAEEYLNKILAKYDTKADLPPSPTQLVNTASALAALVRQNGYSRNGKIETDTAARDLYTKGIRGYQKDVPTGANAKFGRDDLVYYYHSQAEFSVGANWSAYRKHLFDALQKGQNKDGSWPESEGICAGQVYATALWCTVLQLDKRSHPSIPPVRHAIVT
jgi:hypothetical protein